MAAIVHEHAADHGHGHIKLQYQPALPLGRGKLCLWLFLSTEIMFFAGLIGTYIVLRFGAPANTWPAQGPARTRASSTTFSPASGGSVVMIPDCGRPLGDLRQCESDKLCGVLLAANCKHHVLLAAVHVRHRSACRSRL